MRVALIAHDKKKEEMVNFAKINEERLSHLELYATGTTGLRIMENTNLEVHRLKSGPLGGDQQIGALVSEQKLDLVISLLNFYLCNASNTNWAVETFVARGIS